MTAKDLHIFRHLFLSCDPEQLCKRKKRKKEKKRNKQKRQFSSCCDVPGNKCIFCLPALSSEFCSSNASDVRLEASRWFSLPFVPPAPTKGVDFSQNTEAHRMHEVSEAKMGSGLKTKKKEN